MSGYAFTLADAAPDLARAAAWLPGARRDLAWARQQTGPVLASVALANDADPAQGGAALLLAAASAACDSIAGRLDEVEQSAGVVRVFVDANPALHGKPAPPDIYKAWSKVNVSMRIAQVELERLMEQIRQ